MMRDSSRIRNYLWRRKLVIETTFAINALEPWEKLIFCAHYLFPSFPSFAPSRSSPLMSNSLSAVALGLSLV